MSADKSLFSTTMTRFTALAILLLAAVSAWAAYTVHSVAGDVKLMAKGEKIRLKKGMALQPSDELELSKGAYVEIFNDLDAQVYRCEKPGRLSVMRLLLDAKRSASDNGETLGGHISVGRSADPGKKVFTETGMIRRRISFADEREFSQSPGSSDLTVNRIRALLAELPQRKAKVGVAMVADTDTFTVNNRTSYPMMSVFKLHQALAVADRLARSGSSLDSAIYIPMQDLDRDTWSPMLEKYGDEDSMISVGELARYAVTSSDNNASNLLFKRIVSPEDTDRFIRSVAPDTTFRISCSEAEMKENHELCRANHSTPLSAALLIRKVFTDSIVAPEMQDSIKGWLSSVTTGADRLGAPVKDKSDVLFAHKTGSGYRDAEGLLTAHNDVGYFRLPDGRSYALAVLIRDFDGTDNEASALIAEISRIVYEETLSSKRMQP